ncbi:MAG: TonB-dependent receptor [Porticoccaceae bacterium]|nr:TonB-dependent receptor [Porticoccaceae bacterium]
MTLTGLIAHSDYEQDQVQDGDGHHLVTAGFIHNKGEAKSTFAEIRLAGDQDSLRWLLGANYEDSSTMEDQLLEFSNNTTYRPQTLWITRTGSLLEQDIESYAVFGNIDYDLNEALTLKLGARYTDTTIDAYSCNYAPLNAPGSIDTSGNGVAAGSNVAGLFNFLGGLSGRPFDPIGPGDCFTLDNFPGAGVPGTPFINELAEDNISWRAGIDYQLNEDTLLYANISQGYKAGSYPTLAANDFNQLLPVTEESVLAYEIGFKQSMAEGRVQWNGAVFYYDYEDKQERGKIEIALFGPLDRLVNVPESTIFGAETDIVAQLTDKLTLTAALTYLDSEIDEYTGFDVYGEVRDLSGNELPYTPELAYSLDLDYRTPLQQGGTLFMGINVVGQTDSDGAFDADDLSIYTHPSFPGNINGGFHKSITENYFTIESYATVGARIGYESDDTRWRVMLWGKNITDEYYYNSVIASSEGAARVAGRPRTYGITVGYQY